MTIDLEMVNAMNRCQIAEMEKIGQSLDPGRSDASSTFAQHVLSAQSAIMHTWQIVAFASVREKDPAAAAMLWKDMGEYCDLALKSLNRLKDIFPGCGTPELYDLALDYKLAAERRHLDNLHDSECQHLTIPPGLFPKKN